MPKINVATIPANHPALNAAPAESPSDDNEEEEPAQTRRTKAGFAAVRGKLLEASIHSQLAQMGYASFGVAVSDEGDVYLEGTFLSQADQDRVLAMVRRFKHVRDISFSGSVWHTEHASADGAAEATASGTGDEAAPPPAVAKPAEPSAPELPAAQPKSAPSDEEFPITAADVPAPPNRYAAPPSPLPTPSQSQSTSPLQ
jgi:hypothetical protein